MKFNQRVIFLSLSPPELEFEFFVGLFEFHNLYFGLLKLFFEPEKLICDDE